MSGATFDRLKDWIAEVLTYADLNAEIDNILENLDAMGVGGYSTNVAQMKLQTDPGELGTESLAESLAEELERLRYVIAEMKFGSGATNFWYPSAPYSLATLGASLGGGTPANRLISGAVKTTSSRANFLQPSGAARTVTLLATDTDFVYAVNGTEYTVALDTTLVSMSAAPSSNNTCLVNDAGLDGSESTKYIGEHGTDLIVDAMGASISSLIGHLAAFKVGSTEYFIARVVSATQLSEIQRGYFVNSSVAAVPRLGISDNDTITLLKLTWIFINTSGVLLPVYNEPRVGKDQPSTPATGDYWYDLDNSQWKTYNGASFVAANATLIGVCAQDATNTVCARAFDYFRGVSNSNNLELVQFDVTEVRTRNRGASASVYGAVQRFDADLPRWDIDTDLASGLTEAASTLYFLYLTDEGDTVIDTQGPQDRRDLQGLYHPHETWRCFGQVFNNASSDFEAVISYDDLSENNYAVTHSVAANALTLRIHAPPLARNKVRNTAAAVGQDLPTTILPMTRLVIASGSTLGTTNAVEHSLIAHIVYTSGRAELGISKLKYRKDSLVTTTAEAGNGDSPSVLYTLTARTLAPVKAMARLLSTQTVAGTWAAALSNVANWSHSTPFFNQVTLTTDQTFVLPAGQDFINMRGLGGGGGGGTGGSGVDGSDDGGGGGGGGGAAVPYDYNNIPTASSTGLSLTVDIGAGGAAATNGSPTTVSGFSGEVTQYVFPGANKGANATGVTGGAGATLQNSSAIDLPFTGCGPGGNGGTVDPTAVATANNAQQAPAYTLLHGGSVAAGAAAGTSNGSQPDDDHGAGGGGGASSIFGVGGIGGQGSANPGGSPTAGTAADVTHYGAGGGGGGGGREAGSQVGAAGGAGAPGVLILSWVS